MLKSILVILVALLTVESVTAQALVIDSCYALAVRNYPLIKQYQLIEKTREYTLSNAGKAYLPQLSITAIEGYVFGGLPSPGGSEAGSSNFKFIGVAQLNQTIWDGGATKTQKAIINASLEKDKASIDVALHEIRSRVSQLYFGILLIDEQLKQLEIQNSLLKNNITRIQELNDKGLAYRTDVDEIKVEQLKLDQQRTEFVYTRNGYLDMLSLLTGTKLNGKVIFEKPQDPGELGVMQVIRPELLLYKSQRNQVNAEAGLQRVSLMPKIGFLGAGLLLAPGSNFGNSTVSSLGIAGLSASWNISGLYKNSNQKELTILALNKVNVQEETFLFNTNLQMTQTSANIQKQKAILSEDDAIVDLRKTIREGYQVKYDNGISPLLDLLNATEKEHEARSQRALHEMQLLMTLYDYKLITGN